MKAWLLYFIIKTSKRHSNSCFSSTQEKRVKFTVSSQNEQGKQTEVRHVSADTRKREVVRSTQNKLTESGDRGGAFNHRWDAGVGTAAARASAASGAAQEAHASCLAWLANASMANPAAPAAGGTLEVTSFCTKNSASRSMASNDWSV